MNDQHIKLNKIKLIHIKILNVVLYLIGISNKFGNLGFIVVKSPA